MSLWRVAPSAWIDGSSTRRFVRTLTVAVCAVASAGSARAQVVISQIFGGGGNTGAVFESDYIELCNLGAPQSLAGWSVQFASAGGSTWQVTALPPFVLGTGQSFLVREQTGSTVSAPQSLALPAPDASGTIAMSATDGKVALCNSVAALFGTTPVSPQIVDFVGYGSLAGFNEPGAPFSAANNAPSPSNNLALFRLDCAARDVGINREDWAVGLPQPRNMGLGARGGLGAGAMVQPHFAEEGDTVRIVCEPFACGSLATNVATSASVDLTIVGGAPNTPLFDDGTNGDSLAGDGLFSLDVVVPSGLTSNTFHLPVTFSNGVASGSVYASFNVMSATAPDNDNCSTALTLVGPYTTPVQLIAGFAGATVEYNLVQSASTSNPGNMGSRRGVWFEVQGSGNTLTVDTCASGLIGGSTIPDTVLMVFAGDCENLATVAANDDVPTSCGVGSGTERRSRASWCSVAGERYLVWVAPFAPTAQTFNVTLTVSDDGAPCTGAYVPNSCGAPAVGTAEGEPGFGPANNDGCDSSPQLFVAANPGFPAQVFRGTARAFGNARDSDWYRFQASASEVFNATLTAQFSGVLELRQLSPSGTCGTNTLVQSSAVGGMCTSTALSAAVTAGSWYAVRVIPTGSTPPGSPSTAFGGIAPGASSYHYQLELALGAAPLNDLCANAQTLVFGVDVAGQTNVATSSEASTVCDPSGRDVWYAVTLTSPGTLHVDTCGSLSDVALALFDGCGASELACNDTCPGSPCGGPAACLSVPSLAPGTYRIRVSDLGSPAQFVVRASFEYANDSCAGAIPIAVPSTTLGSTVGATPESNVPPAIGPLGVQDFSATAPSVWYSITVPGVSGVDDRTIYLDTLTASFDTKLSVFTGSCGALVSVTANDDIAPTFRSKVGFHAVANVTYYVLVHGFNTSTGSFALNAELAGTTSNDNCVDAITLSPAGGSLLGNLSGASGEANFYSATDLSSCASSYTVFDVWYRFDATCDTTLTLDTCGSTDTILSAHSACPDPFTAFEIFGACNDDGAGVCAPGSQLSLSVASGASYWIRVAHRTSDSTPGPFTLTWSSTDGDGDGFADCVDGCPFDPFKSSPGACGCGVSDLDTDGDNVADCLDGCPNDSGKISPGVCGCGVSDVDSDGDGAADCVDGCPVDPDKITPGVCGCGVSDADTDGDGVVDCNDGCPLDPNKSAAGVCGCGVLDVDTDGDGTFDCVDGCPSDPSKVAPGACGCGELDTDSDGDGVADCVDGCPLDPLKSAPGACGCGVEELDLDLDGVLDCFDNCPSLSNSGQEDCDFDGLGDVCELAAGSTDTDANGVPDECQLGAVLSYCTAGTSSNGCTATMSAIGVASASATSGFSFHCDQLEGQRSVLFFYGVGGPAIQQWGLGSTSYKCVRSPVQRTAPTSSGGTAGLCDGSHALDFAAYSQLFPGSLGLPFTAGDVLAVQAWYRDPTAPNATNLSNAIQITMAP